MDTSTPVSPMAVNLLVGDWIAQLRTLPDKSVHCCVTSPPYYGLRDYGTATWEGGSPECKHQSPTMRAGRNEDRPMLAGSSASNSGQLLLAARSACGKCGAVRVDQQVGLERSPEEYVAKMVEGFGEVYRVLRDDGTLWLNIGDSYATKPMGKGSTHDPKYPHGRNRRGNASECNRRNDPSSIGAKHKDLLGIPWMLAFALRSAGWYLRSDVIWHKPNAMPSSVRDRPSTAHEYLFLFAKQRRYFYDDVAVQEAASGKPGGASFGKQKSKPTLNPNVATQQRPRTYERPEYKTRNRRSVWSIPTRSYKGAHFATFPPALITPCIQAGTSEKGVCPGCGAPWIRLTKRVATGEVQKAPDGWDDGNGSHGTIHREGRSKGKANVPVLKMVSDGWTPSCRCPAADPVAATVLDPFAGSGTTLATAVALGRRAVGIELNADYLPLIHQRIAATSAKKAG